MDLLDTFRIGMDRPLPEFKQGKYGIRLNLGAGNKQIAGAVPVDYPEWKAGQSLPFPSGSVTQIYAFHFFEHLTKVEVIATLHECQRVLDVGGLMNIVVPHWSCEGAHQDLDHKTFWGENTLRQTLKNDYYTGSMEAARGLRFNIVSTAIMGIVHRNLAVITQLERF